MLNYTMYTIFIYHYVKLPKMSTLNKLKITATCSKVLFSGFYGTHFNGNTHVLGQGTAKTFTIDNLKRYVFNIDLNMEGNYVQEQLLARNSDQ